jgi:hypothetical protein
LVFVLIYFALILSLLFFFGGPDYYSTRSFKHFWDLGHIVFFAIFTYIILSLWQKLSNQTFWRQCAWIFGITLCLGVIEIARWGGDAEFAADRNIAFHGKSSLKVQLNTSTYSGVGLKYFPRDWQGFRALEFSIYNLSSEPLKMTCRVHDRQHTRGPGPELYSDRFNRSFLLSKGWNPITIDLEEIAQAPKNRRMNMSQIQGISVFAVQLPQPRVIYLDYIRLSK